MSRITITGGDLTMFRVGAILEINGNQVTVMDVQQTAAGQFDLDVERFTAARLKPVPDAPRWQTARPYLKRKKGRS